ncbi:STAS domain-containing protein [Streptomyces sp. NPDC020379]|uniref:STAS domain-containing protein n=1 Tax=Streptomyces sp. NPDC020379 TaxID=3365071 RepID=UPI00379D59DF
MPVDPGIALIPTPRRLVPAGTRQGHVVTVRGKLDLAGVPGLRERLLRVSHTPGSRLILDLSGVTSCDALGLGLLVATARRARRAGGDLCLVAPRPAVVRALGASGLSRLLPTLPGAGTTVRSAGAAMAGPRNGNAA